MTSHSSRVRPARRRAGTPGRDGWRAAGCADCRVTWSSLARAHLRHRTSSRPRQTERVGNVALTSLGWGVGACRWPRPLDPLSAKIRRDLAPLERALARLARGDSASRGINASRVEELDACPIARATGATLRAALHHGLTFGIELRERRQDPQRRLREDVGVFSGNLVADLKGVCRHDHLAGILQPPASTRIRAMDVS